MSRGSKRAFCVAALLMTLTLVAAACGDDDDTASDDTAPSLRTGSERTMPGAVG